MDTTITERFEVNLEEEKSISNTLDLLITKNLDKLFKELEKLERTDYLEHIMKFGITKDNEFQEYEMKEKYPVIREEILYTSELAFFIEAVKYEECIRKVAIYVDRITYINRAVDSNFWTNEEVPKGLYPAFALVYQNIKYTDEFINLLRTMDMDHEVYQDEMILLLFKKWGFDNNEMLKLAAARTWSICGQCGDLYWSEDEYPVFTDEQKGKIFHYLMEDYFYENYRDVNFFYEIIQDTQLDIEKEKFIKLFDDDANPKYTFENIPKLSDVEK